MSATETFIHRFVPGESKRTLLVLHGTGGNEDDLLPVGRMLDSGERAAESARQGTGERCAAILSPPARRRL